MVGKAKGKGPKTEIHKKEANSQFKRELITFVSEEPSIWKPDHKDYSKTDKRSNLFESFAKRYEDAQVTGPSCALLWKSLKCEKMFEETNEMKISIEQ